MTPVRWASLGLGAAVGVAVARGFPELAARLGMAAAIYQRFLQSLVAFALFAVVLLVVSGRPPAVDGAVPVRRQSRFWLIALLAVTSIGLVAVSTLDRVGRSGVPTRIAVSDLFEWVVPTSVVEAAVQGQPVQILFWSAIFALGLSQARLQTQEAMLRGVAGLSLILSRLTGFAEALAPAGVGAAVAARLGRHTVGLEPGLQLAVMAMTFGLLLGCDALCRTVPTE